jgi:hypothetical protein
VYSHAGLFRLSANRECRAAAPYVADWDRGRVAAQFTLQRSAIENYLDVVTTTVHPGRWLKEGRVETRLASRGQSFAVMDRQPRFGFPSTLERQHVLAEMCERFEEYLDGAKASSEGDVLALDGHGRLLVIEVKHVSAKDLAWSPAQACFDAALVRLWSSEASANAAEILNGMLEQRLQLGLSPELGVRLSRQFEIVPVAAVGPVEDPTLLPDRMFAERDRLLDTPLAPTGVEIWAVREDGDIIRVTP